MLHKAIRIFVLAGMVTVLFMGTGGTHQINASPLNLVSNSSVEEGVYSPSNLPTHWRTNQWSGGIGTTFTWDNSVSHSGSKSIKIEATSPNDAHWLQDIPVEPNKDYILTGWIKTENVLHSSDLVDPGANLTLFNTWTRTIGIFGTTDWTFVQVAFNSGDSSLVTIGGRLGYWAGLSVGTVWFDDIEVTPVEVGLLQNPGFEEQNGLLPFYWSNERSIPEGNLLLDSVNPHSGLYSAKVDLSGFGYGRWSQSVSIEKDTEYELSGWIKTENVVDPAGQWWINGASLRIQGTNSYLAKPTIAIRDTNDWQYLSVRFPTGSTPTAWVMCTLGNQGAPSSGTIWCDDMSLTKIRHIDRVITQGNHIAISFYDYLHDYLNNPQSYVANLDEAYNALADFTGYIPLNGQTITLSSEYPMNYGALAGNPILLTTETYWYNDINQSGGLDFGGTHELSHVFDIPQYRFYMGGPFINAEVWANIKLLYVFDTLGATHPELTVNAPYNAGTIPIGQLGQVFIDRAALPWFNAGYNNYQSWLDNIDNQAGNAYTGLIYSIRQQIGWDPFKALFRDFAAMDTEPTPATDLAKVELMANLLSDHSGVNLIPKFREWGFPIERTDIGTLIGSCAGYEIYAKDGTYNAPSWTGTIQIGDKRSNTLNGTAGPDLILGLGGNDLINGKGGNDVICGGDGVDFLLGSNGNDVLDGGLGNDVLNGGGGDFDYLFGYDGNDALLDGGGVSVASAGAGNDDLIIVLRNGWRNGDDQPNFGGLTAGYGNDKASLSILENVPFTINISGDEYDDPASAKEGKNDKLALIGNQDPASKIVKFENIYTPRSDEVAALAEDAGAEYLTEEVGEDTVYLPLIAR